MSSNKTSVGEVSQLYHIRHELPLSNKYLKVDMYSNICYALCLLFTIVIGLLPIIEDGESPRYMFRNVLGAWGFFALMSIITLTWFNNIKKKTIKKMNDVVATNNQLLKNYRDSVTRFFKSVTLDYVIDNLSNLEIDTSIMLMKYTGMEFKRFKNNKENIIYPEYEYTHHIDVGTHILSLSTNGKYISIDQIEIPLNTLSISGMNTKNKFLIWKKFHEMYGDKMRVTYNTNRDSICLLNPKWNQRVSLHQSMMRHMMTEDFGEYMFNNLDLTQYLICDQHDRKSVMVRQDDDSRLKSLDYNIPAATEDVNSIINHLCERGWREFETSSMGTYELHTLMKDNLRMELYLNLFDNMLNIKVMRIYDNIDTTKE